MSLSELLPPMIARVKAAVPGLIRVEGLDAADDFTTTPGATPACYIVPAAEAFTTTQRGAGLINVEVNCDIDAVIVVRRSSQRSAAKSELMAISEAVIATLLGWTPEADMYRPMEPLSARLFALTGDHAAWLVRFRTVYRLRKQG